LSASPLFAQLRSPRPHTHASVEHIPIPVMVSQSFREKLEPAYLCNGMIGIRPGPNPLVQANTEVSGFVSSTYGPHLVEGQCPAPYPFGVDLRVDDVSLLENPDRVKVERQTMDLTCGELVTRMVFSPSGEKTLNLGTLQFASRSVPCLLCQEVSITPSTDMSVEVVARIDLGGVPGRVYFSHAAARSDIDLTLGFASPQDHSRLGIAVVVVNPEGFQRIGEQGVGEQAITRRFRLQAKAGQTYTFRGVAAMVSHFYHPAPELQAYRMAKWGETLGFETLRQENRARWQELWMSRVKVSGDEEAQRILDAAFFYLQSSVHVSNQNGLSPFGLSHFLDYGGHSFWDTETNCFLPILMAAPATARSLLEFRVRGLDSARKLADLYGYRGAHFPWEASPIDGAETTPTWAATGWEEQHITPDVAIAFWEYQVATGDVSFLHKGTWPVLKAVAEWIESRGVYTSRGFEIRHIMGSDEGSSKSNNNSYVNIACKMALLAAINCARAVGLVPPSAWTKMINSLVVPTNSTKGIILPADNVTEGPTYPQVNLDFLTVHDIPAPTALLRSTYEYEMKARGTRKMFGTLPVGIGFATAAVAATAARFGDRAGAARLFHQSWDGIWIEPFGLSREVPWQPYGCFLTNYGGILQTAMLGFTGLRIRPGDWRKYPATLPQGWKRIEIDRIWIRGTPFHLAAEDGRLAVLTQG